LTEFSAFANLSIFARNNLTINFFPAIFVHPPPRSQPETPNQLSSDQTQFVYKLQHCLTPPCNSVSPSGTTSSIGGKSGDGFTERGVLKFKRSKQRDGYVTIVTNNDQDVVPAAVDVSDTRTPSPMNDSEMFFFVCLLARLGLNLFFFLISV
jgi:hypothetical protein